MRIQSKERFVKQEIHQIGLKRCGLKTTKRSDNKQKSWFIFSVSKIQRRSVLSMLQHPTNPKRPDHHGEERERTEKRRHRTRLPLHSFAQICCSLPLISNTMSQENSAPTLHPFDNHPVPKRSSKTDEIWSCLFTAFA